MWTSRMILSHCLSENWLIFNICYLLQYLQGVCTCVCVCVSVCESLSCPGVCDPDSFGGLALPARIALGLHHVCVKAVKEMKTLKWSHWMTQNMVCLSVSLSARPFVTSVTLTVSTPPPPHTNTHTYMHTSCRAGNKHIDVHTHTIKNTPAISTLSYFFWH